MTTWAFIAGAAVVLLLWILTSLLVPPSLAPAAEIESFDYSPKPAGPGAPVVFTWKTKGAVCVMLYPSGPGSERIEVASSGTLVLTSPAQSWKLVAIGANGERAVQQVQIARGGGINGTKPAVHVRRIGAGGVASLLACAMMLGCAGETRQLRQPRILSLKAEPDQVPAGEHALLTWAVEGASRLQLEPGGDVTGKQQQKVTPTGSTTYTLTAWSPDGLVDRRHVEVRVYLFGAERRTP